MVFCDVLNIEVVVGNGGDGSMSFYCVKYMEKGGLDGGYGGCGGSIIFCVIEGVELLEWFVGRCKFKVENGCYGEGWLCQGVDGQDIYIDVLVGIIVFDEDSGKVIVDLVNVGQEKVIVKGGLGGWGNLIFISSIW